MSEADRHAARRTWLTTAQVAVELGGCTQSHVRALIDCGDLKALNVARTDAKRADYRLRQEWVDEYLKRRTSGAA
jgi:hypothetical protein